MKLKSVYLGIVVSCILNNVMAQSGPQVWKRLVSPSSFPMQKAGNEIWSSEDKIKRYDLSMNLIEEIDRFSHPSLWSYQILDACVHPAQGSTVIVDGTRRAATYDGTSFSYLNFQLPPGLDYLSGSIEDCIADDRSIWFLADTFLIRHTQAGDSVFPFFSLSGFYQSQVLSFPGWIKRGIIIRPGTNELFITVRKGIIRYSDNAGFSFLPFSLLSGGNTTDGIVDRVAFQPQSGIMYVTYEDVNGHSLLRAYDLDAAQPVTLNATSPLAGVEIYNMEFSASGNLWLMTSAGLARYSNAGISFFLPGFQGVYNNFFYVKSDTEIFLRSEAGILKFDGQQFSLFAPARYDFTGQAQDICVAPDSIFG